MNHANDDDIDALLRAQFDGAVPDDGFTDRVLQRLPPRRRRAAWPLWGGLAAGIAACALSLASAPLVQAGWHDWIGGELSASVVALVAVMAGLSLLACGWTVMEAGEG